MVFAFDTTAIVRVGHVPKAVDNVMARIVGADAQRRARRVPAYTHSHRHVHIGTLRYDPFAHYGRGRAFAVGLVLGVGGVDLRDGGRSERTRFGLFTVFLAGLFVSNTVVALVLGAARSFRVYAAGLVVIACFSMSVGAIMLFGSGRALSPLSSAADSVSLG